MHVGVTMKSVQRTLYILHSRPERESEIFIAKEIEEMQELAVQAFGAVLNVTAIISTNYLENNFTLKAAVLLKSFLLRFVSL
jgi:hypothetical protein